MGVTVLSLQVFDVRSFFAYPKDLKNWTTTLSVVDLTRVADVLVKENQYINCTLLSKVTSTCSRQDCQCGYVNLNSAGAWRD